MFLFKLKMFPRRVFFLHFDMSGNQISEQRWVISRAWTLFGIRLLWKAKDAYLASTPCMETKKVLYAWVSYNYIFPNDLFHSKADAQEYIQAMEAQPHKCVLSNIYKIICMRIDKHFQRLLDDM